MLENIYDFLFTMGIREGYFVHCPSAFSQRNIKLFYKSGDPVQPYLKAEVRKFLKENFPDGLWCARKYHICFSRKEKAAEFKLLLGSWE